MSTQIGTLGHHKTVQVPMWLIVALVVGMLTVALGYAVEQYQGQGAVATSAVRTIPDTQVAAREGTSPQTSTGPEPIVVNGQICHQCR
jgi:hypothetical protein